jgi:hypothetical protein
MTLAKMTTQMLTRRTSPSDTRVMLRLTIT